MNSEIPAAKYTAAAGPPLEIPLPVLQGFQALASEASEPGAAVTVSDLVNELLAAHLDGEAGNLAKIAKQAELDEAQRVAAEHGGEAA
jgi:hypothetical protein